MPSGSTPKDTHDGVEPQNIDDIGRLDFSDRRPHQRRPIFADADVATFGSEIRQDESRLMPIPESTPEIVGDTVPAAVVVTETARPKVIGERQKSKLYHFLTYASYVVFVVAVGLAIWLFNRDAPPPPSRNGRAVGTPQKSEVQLLLDSFLENVRVGDGEAKNAGALMGVARDLSDDDEHAEAAWAACEASVNRALRYLYAGLNNWDEAQIANVKAGGSDLDSNRNVFSEQARTARRALINVVRFDLPEEMWTRIEADEFLANLKARYDKYREAEDDFGDDEDDDD